jgi:hypothetical protein
MWVPVRAMLAQARLHRSRLGWPLARSGGAAGVAQGPGGVVVASQEGARVVVDLQRGVGEQDADLPWGQEHAFEPGAGGAGGPEQAAGGRAGDGLAVFEAVAELVEVVGHGAGSLDVQDGAQPVAGANVVSAERLCGSPWGRPEAASRH